MYTSWVDEEKVKKGFDSCDYGLMRNGETTRQEKPKESHNSSERLTLIADLFAIR